MKTLRHADKGGWQLLRREGEARKYRGSTRKCWNRRGARKAGLLLLQDLLHHWPHCGEAAIDCNYLAGVTCPL